jgi:serine/threonine protein phosphatase PrpC
MYFDRSPGAEAEMAGIIYRHGDDATGAVEDLVATAIDRGGYDNITAVLMGV